MKLGRLFLVALSVLMSGSTISSTAAAHSGPTFDCTDASGEVETLICQDERLAALDRRMAEVYEAAMAALPTEDAATERVMQRGWISGRNECWKEDDVRACTELSYQTRMAQLQIKSGQLIAPIPFGYTCEGGDGRPVTAAFYGQTEPPSVVITVGSDQVIAFRAAAASGARYIAARVEFWEHQGEVTLEWFGTTRTCRVREAARTPLAGTWVLVEFQSMDDTTLQPDGARYALTFEPEGRLLVQSDCNRGQGSWSSPDNVSLSLGPVALTRMACPPSSLQDRFVRDLDFVRSYVMRDGHLYLSLMADGGIYAFEPEPSGAGR